MKLPDPPWLNLREALRWLTDRGVSEELAKNRLCQAFRYREIQTKGRVPGIPFSERLYDVPELAWEKGSVKWDSDSIYYDDEWGSHRRINDVEVCRNDLANWIKDSAEVEASITQTDGSRTSESPGYRSPYMTLMLAAEANFGMRLASSQDYAKKDEIEDWLRENWATFVRERMTENRVRAMASLIRDPELGKGGNRRFK